jgi:YHS domain-containing protein
MKRVILALAAVAVLSSAVCAAPKAKDAKAPKEVACAVMKDHKVNIAKATKDKMFADYEGKRYFFCCAGCPAEFKKDPKKFASAPHIPTPKK